MTKIITVPTVIKGVLGTIASQSKYIQVLEILERGKADELVIRTDQEAQAVVNVARVHLLDTQLKYPYWDDSTEPYDEDHEEQFQDVQMGVFEKTVYYVGQEFEIESKT